MTCFMNLSKHLKGCYETKTNREMLEYDFQIFANLNDFLKTKIKYFLFTFVQNFKPKKIF
jgi:hypothetical protein